ncbi:TPA: hypothetical protein ACHKB2_002255 [Acinetobacter baumannii]|uniref:hypothetical protein n=1 Tax=Acinetobacter baumannii TaxID=470 RepID=UPI0008DCE628|nr:hypothetical protein [Acinetobacter baumannii]OIH04565.1 hypothetical protein A7M79_15000 [Acinetobacter baumannii]
MSLVLRSNISAENSLGTYKSITSDPATEFNSYKARVLADGGEVMNDADTLAAFKYLINSGIYGIARTFVGSKFGIKRDSNGSVLKLYALDGIDLVAYNINNSALPVTIVNSELSFNNVVQASASQTSGTIFISNEKIATRGRGLVLGVKGSSIKSSTVAEQGVAALSLLDNVANATPLWFAALAKSGGGITVGRQIGETPNQNSSAQTQRATCYMAETGSSYVAFADYKNKLFKGYRDRALVTMPAIASQFSNLDGFEGYINFGGMVYNISNAKERRLANMKVSLFYLYDNLPESKVETIAKF